MGQIASAWSKSITVQRKVSAVYGGNETAKFIPFDGVKNDYFGYATAISSAGDTIAIGAYYDDDKGSNSGSVYIYRRSGSTWVRSIKLVAYDGYSNDYFGHSLALSGDGQTLVVGSYLDDDEGTNSGSAYVYVRTGDDTWVFQSKLTSVTEILGDYFGRNVDISYNGNRIVIGVYLADTKGVDSGAMYIFDRSGTTWNEVFMASGSDSAANDYFGRGVAISPDGETVMIGAYQDDDKGSASGSVYVFRKVNSVWSQVAKIVPTDGAANDYFGFAIDLSYDGHRAVIASYLDDDKGSNSGSVYIYAEVNGVWTRETKLTASDGASTDYFGYSLSFDEAGVNLVIGAYLDDDKGSGSGSIYFFSKSTGTWIQKYKISGYDSAAGDYYGFSVSLSGNGAAVIAGAYLNNGNNLTKSGAVYLTE